LTGILRLSEVDAENERYINPTPKFSDLRTEFNVPPPLNLDSEPTSDSKSITISHLLNEGKQKDDEISDLRSALYEKDEQIAQLKQLAYTRDTEMLYQIRSKDSEIERLNAKLARVKSRALLAAE
jgi:hypothetical protein